MFEHVRSRSALLGRSLDLLTRVTRYIGPAMNRDTVGNAQRAGFVIDRALCAYLDIFLAIEAHKPATNLAMTEHRASPVPGQEEAL